eukprot:TRINITY_DN47943_c0_g1_i1.p1 TRINITY_DN47943_c0_g1~~TRINITY_DN47943_c0_g1_i1.p1  ORF type:complete len:134 (+),score=26.70 TRINITY_DN47943_c0_g1_i1:30-431(+)
MCRLLQLEVNWECGCVFLLFFFFQAEDGIRDVERSRGLGDVYKRQSLVQGFKYIFRIIQCGNHNHFYFLGSLYANTLFYLTDLLQGFLTVGIRHHNCLLYTSDAADDTPCVDLGGRRIIKKKKRTKKLVSCIS